MLNEIVIKRFASSLIRHGLTALGAVLVAQNLTDEASWTALATDATPILLSLVWSLYEKRWKPKTA